VLLRILEKNRCSIPRIKCRSCDDTLGGYYDSANNQIILCSQKGRKMEEYQMTLLHELSHVKDRCISSIKSGCDEKELRAKACSEVRAYKYANEILDKDELISRVEKSLLKTCPKYKAKDPYIPLLVATQAVEFCFDLPIEDALLSW
jgi:hypothetical protein